jgi:hypothetical protein
MERLYISNPDTILGEYWFPPDQIYVSVKSSEINNNNVATVAPYTITETNGEPYCDMWSQTDAGLGLNCHNSTKARKCAICVLGSLLDGRRCTPTKVGTETRPPNF